MEDRVYDVTTLIHERFPDAYFDFHLLNPDWFEDGHKEGDVLEGLPAFAEEIPL